MENEIINLCITCSHNGKCRRLKKLHRKLTKITEDYFEKFDIDIDVEFNINECPKCDVDIEALEELDEYDFGGLGFEDEDDDE